MIAIVEFGYIEQPSRKVENQALMAVNVF